MNQINICYVFLRLTFQLVMQVSDLLMYNRMLIRVTQKPNVVQYRFLHYEVLTANETIILSLPLVMKIAAINGLFFNRLI
jgi:hypothetical protein